MRSSYREVLRCLLEGVQWLLDPSVNVKVAWQVRHFASSEPPGRRTAEEFVRGGRGSGRKTGDQGCLLPAVACRQSGWKHAGCGRYRGKRTSLRVARLSLFPKIRFVALLENGTHVLWAACMGRYSVDDLKLAEAVFPPSARICSFWPTVTFRVISFGRRRRVLARTCLGEPGSTPFCIQTSTCRTAPTSAESTRRHRTDAQTPTPLWCV